MKQLAILIRRFGDRPVMGAELGVLEGATSAAMLREFPNLFLYMIDPWAVYEQPLVAGHPYAKHTQEWWDGTFRKAIENTAFAKARRVVLRPVGCVAAAPAGLDFVFIDARHDYDSVSADFRHWWPQITGGGFIAGHDYGNSSPWTENVQRAIDDFGAEVNLPVRFGDGHVAWIDRPSRKD